jgi:molybdopterin molybdotransferase
MLSVEEARARILDGVARLSSETIDLEAASGRTLAAPVIATRDQPPFDASLMDGYALRAADTPGKLLIVGESAAGAAFGRALGHSEAVRISTGAPLPHGADAVLAQEDASVASDTLAAPPVEPARYVRARAGDFRAGATLLTVGRVIDPGAMMILAGAGAERVQVTRRPKVSILSNGGELVLPGDRPRDDQIFDSASFAVASLARAWGADARRSPPLPDDEGVITDAVQRELGSCDVLVFIGGASVGPHDHARRATEGLGIKVLFSGIAVRPGRPTWFARAPDSLVLGLPGNPASALVCARLFLAPLIEIMLCRDAMRSCVFDEAPLAASMSANGNREAYVRAMKPPGAKTIAPISDEDSSLMSVLANSNALVRRKIGARPAPAGEPVEFMSWTP